jgi:Uma2 family endonuclease
MTTIHQTGGADGLDRRAFTVSEVQQMLQAGVLDRDEKFELIRGEIVPMAPEMSRHAQMKARLARWFGRRIDDKPEVGNDITVKLGDNGLFEADVLIWRPVRQGKFIPLSNALLAIEVADTTLSSDLAIKAPDYGRAGLADLWVVDVSMRVTHVHRGPTKEGGGYRDRTEIAFDAPVSPLFAADLALRIADLG